MRPTGNILIVDDEPHVRRYLSLVARTLGPVQVHEAADGEAALALYQTLVPAPILIMLDVNMPGIDGIETLRRFRAAGYDNAAVMLTSLANRQTIEDAIAAGADHYMRKDATKEEILAGLQTVLAQIDSDAAEGEDTPPAS